MSAELQLLLVLGGFVLRYGLPILFLAAAVWLLRRLDAHWQAEARRLPQSRLRLPAGPACWQVNGCSADRRAACPAFLNSPTPCWQTFRDRDGNLRAGCLACQFFRQAQPPVLVTAVHQGADRR
jgi:hypothetical protein